MSNQTHRKALARRLSARTDLTYQQALTQVTRLATVGLLPARLDEQGMTKALALLTEPSRAAQHALARAGVTAEATQLWCEKSGAAPGADSSTHHLVPRAAGLTCRYCKRTAQDILKGSPGPGALGGESERVWCPYPDCGFGGTEDDVDDHRTYAHRDEAQAGSNLRHRPRLQTAAEFANWEQDEAAWDLEEQAPLDDPRRAEPAAASQQSETSVEDWIPADAWPFHYTDAGEACRWSGALRGARTTCPAGCDGSRYHYVNDGHEACADESAVSGPTAAGAV